MKKLKISFLLFLFILTATLSHAGMSNYPLGPEWGEEDITRSPQFEEAFLALYQITETETDDEKVFRAFLLMDSIHQRNGMVTKHQNNEIQSSELQQLLSTLYPAAMENPQTAKDYFYRGLLTYRISSGGGRYRFPVERLDHFNYVIDNYPDSVYAKYSYLILAGDSIFSAGRPIEAEDVMNRYIAKYGEIDVLDYFAYFLISKIQYKLYTKNYKSNSALAKEHGDKIIDTANKIMNRFPTRKDVTGFVLLDLASYYSLSGKSKKALEANYIVYNDPEYDSNIIGGALHSIVAYYEKTNNFKKAESILEDAKAKHFSDHRIRKFYKERKRNLDEIRVYGYDEYDRSKPSREKYKQKKTAIDAFRQQYEQSWDADFNMIAPLPVPGQ